MLVLAQKFINTDIPALQDAADYWPAWAPARTPVTESGSDDQNGTELFLGAAGWIFRHELAHIFLDHADRGSADGLRSEACEAEADQQATVWVQDRLAEYHQRDPGAEPSVIEHTLEAEAMALGIGLIWVAMFEADAAQKHDSHPSAWRRLVACLDQLDLRSDSPGKEMLADFIVEWTDPARATPTCVPNSDAAFRDSLVDLVRLLEDKSAIAWPKAVAEFKGN